MTIGQGCQSETKTETEAGQSAALGDPLVLEGPKTAIKVTPDRVIDPVPVSGLDSPSGARIVGIVLTLENEGEKTFTDSLRSAKIITTSGGEADAIFLVSGGECLDDFANEAEVSPKDSQTGCVPFQVPDGETPDRLQLGLGSDSGEWELQ